MTTSTVTSEERREVSSCESAHGLSKQFAFELPSYTYSSFLQLLCFSVWYLDVSSDMLFWALTAAGSRHNDQLAWSACPLFHLPWPENHRLSNWQTGDFWAQLELFESPRLWQRLKLCFFEASELEEKEKRQLLLGVCCS